MTVLSHTAFYSEPFVTKAESNGSLSASTYGKWQFDLLILLVTVVAK